LYSSCDLILLYQELLKVREVLGIKKVENTVSIEDEIY